MPSDCTDCRLASVRLWHGYFADCDNCKARMVSRSPQFFAARKAGVQGWDYTTLLVRAGVSHEQVKAAAEADAANKERS